MVCVAGWVLSLLLAAQADPLPVPSEKAQSDAEKTIREVFKDEYGIKTTPAQQKLAKKLVQQGQGTNDDASLKYVLLREAAELSVRSGEVDTLLLSLEEICKVYRLDGPAFRHSYLSKAEPGLTRPEDLRKLADALFTVVREASLQEQFDIAARSAQASTVAAKKSKDIALAVRADGLLKSVAESRSAFEQNRKTEAALAATPNDPAANQTRGEYLCLVKGQWEPGLAHLAKGSNGTLKTLATKDAAAPTELPAMVEVADGWWELMEKEKSSLRKERLQGRAVHWYEKALPAAAGLTKTKIEKRLAEIGDPVSGSAGTGSPVSGGMAAGLVAWWRFDEKGGTSAADSNGKNNALVLSAGAAWGEGRTGGALVLDGRGAHAAPGDSVFMNVDRDSFSVACFVKPAGTTPFRIINKWDLGASAHGWVLDINTGSTGPGAVPPAAPGTVRVKMADNGTGFVDYAVDAGLNPGTWKHLAFTADFKGEGLKIYVDGTQVGKVQSLTGFSGSLNTTAPLGVGWMSGSPGNYFNGSIDDLRLYRRVLTANEVRELAGRR